MLVAELTMGQKQVRQEVRIRRQAQVLLDGAIHWFGTGTKGPRARARLAPTSSSAGGQECRCRIRGRLILSVRCCLIMTIRQNSLQHPSAGPHPNPYHNPHPHPSVLLSDIWTCALTRSLTCLYACSSNSSAGCNRTPSCIPTLP